MECCTSRNSAFVLVITMGRLDAVSRSVVFFEQDRLRHLRSIPREDSDKMQLLASMKAAYCAPWRVPDENIQQLMFWRICTRIARVIRGLDTGQLGHFSVILTVGTFLHNLFLQFGNITLQWSNPKSLDGMPK
jgi:hypothetical protein